MLPERRSGGTLLNGRDVMGVMPTGAGKSVCYQLPALMLPGLTLVISPLISLMKDQVAGLIQAGIPAAYINSTLDLESYRDVFRQVRRGECRLLYVAPERLQTEGFLHLTEELPVSMVAVDEAHCVSQWGQDFRPSYLQIAELIRNLPQRPVVGAFTATATQQVREDIENLLELQNPLRVTTGFDRPNLSFEVARPAKKSPWLFDFLSGNPNQSGIVYCSTRKTVDAVWMELQEQGIPAARYHAGMADQERKESQEDFVYDRVRVMVATNAFGMGIDKSNVSFVVHYNMPKDLESYYQEAGRAGRDGEPARCVLLFAPSDIRTAQFLISNSQEDLDPERERLSLSRLNRMVRYCKTTDCLRGGDSGLLRRTPSGTLWELQLLPGGIHPAGYHFGGAENPLRRGSGGEEIPVQLRHYAGDSASPGQSEPEDLAVGAGYPADLWHYAGYGPAAGAGLYRSSAEKGLSAF